MTEMLGDVYRARKEPVTLAEFDRLRTVREDRTLGVEVSGVIRDGKFIQDKPQVISASDIVTAAKEAAQRLRLRREVGIG